MAHAVPVAQATQLMPTAAAVPVGAVPTAQAHFVAQGTPVPGLGQDEAFTPGQGYTPQVPTERWASELCNLTAAGGDMCCAVFCCSWVTGPQLYEKVLGRKGSCMMIAPILLIFWVARSIADVGLRTNPILVERATEEGEEGEAERETNMMFFVWLGVFFAASLALCIGSACVLSAVRKRIREKDQIGTASCGEAEDCCCSFFCGCCVNIQIFNHIDMRCATGYKLCSPEGIPTEGGPQV